VLAKFAPVRFTNAAFDGNVIAAYPGNTQCDDKINTPHGISVLAQSSGLRSGNSFTVTWRRSY
jgi:hypothetical protein